tara:strand:- start:47 stop:544 length:498 start_codon:yes stop_codon:yes gene_type:complete
MPYMLDGRQLRVGRSFKTSDGATWTNQWATVLSDEEKTAAGITWEDDPAPFDNNFYFSVGNPRDVATLKTTFIKQQKQLAATALSNTDWYVTRKSESDTAIPSDVLTYRAAVRTVCGTREAEINAASDTAALEALMKATDKVVNEANEVVDNPAAHLTPWPAPLS